MYDSDESNAPSASEPDSSRMNEILDAPNEAPGPARQFIIELPLHVTISEPKVPRADPRLAEQGRHCQRLGEDGWKRIRYAGVKRRFEATPSFVALQVNSILASVTPRNSTVAQLETMDQTLGAITHGLIQQRSAFEEVCRTLDPNTGRQVRQAFLNPDSEFKKISDDLLQYTCGRRAQVIQQRREIYKSSNKVVNRILHDIPPSETHLFCDDRLMKAIEDVGGLKRFFPKKSPRNRAKRSRRERSRSN